MAIVKEMFHEVYSADGERGVKSADPVLYYKDMMSYIFGNTIIDITNDAITNFKINRNNKFAVECVRWELLTGVGRAYSLVVDVYRCLNGCNSP
jgi:hypothetical protein